MRILFVCLGNICRSPMAEGIMRAKLVERELDLVLDSCGTTAFHEGENPDPRAQEEMKARGVEIGDLVARPFRDEDFQRFDRIYTMDRQNQEDILDRAQDDEERAKVDMVLNRIPELERDTPVPDPYFGAEDGFRTVYELLDRASEHILKEIADEPAQS